ncbi:DUF6893 family small protein [Actinomadura rugatobispora]|uniref:DUF6893 family small protein n=1 Tax=Actinomadura rugatobispora TaxID=1994 RepID=A0ABW0ZUR1_9ACTN
MRRPLTVLGVVAGAAVLVALWREYPAMARYIKMERM